MHGGSHHTPHHTHLSPAHVCATSKESSQHTHFSPAHMCGTAHMCAISKESSHHTLSRYRTHVPDI
eukprot:1032919-Rhodomonas_salina.4